MSGECNVCGLTGCVEDNHPDEAAERTALVERITDALVQFDREQYEGYTGRSWPDDKHRLSRIARVNDANHAAWAAQRHFVEGHGGIVGKLAADFHAATDEVTRLRAELADLRSTVADELSRDGQEMRLDEPVEKPMTTAQLRMACEIGYPMLMSRTNMRLIKAVLDSRDDARTALNQALTERNEALAELAKPRCTFNTCGGDDVSGLEGLRAKNRQLTTELATLRAGRAAGREALVDALDGALVELKRLRFSVKAKHIPYPEELDEEIDRVQAVLLANPGHSPVFAAPPSDTPVPEQFCAHHGDHTYTCCTECGKPLDPCAHSVPAPPSDQPEAVEPNVDLLTSPSVVENFDIAGLNPSEVREWLAGSESRRDIPGPVDDPEQIADRIRELRATEFAEDHVPHTRQTLERLAKHLCERYDANQLTWESADGRDRRHWRREASFALDVLGRNGQ